MKSVLFFHVSDFKKKMFCACETHEFGPTHLWAVLSGAAGAEVPRPCIPHQCVNLCLPIGLLAPAFSTYPHTPGLRAESPWVVSPG